MVLFIQLPSKKPFSYHHLAHKYLKCHEWGGGGGWGEGLCHWFSQHHPDFVITTVQRHDYKSAINKRQCFDKSAPQIFTLVALSASMFFKYVMAVSQTSQVSLLPTLRTTFFSSAEVQFKQTYTVTYTVSYTEFLFFQEPCTII